MPSPVVLPELDLAEPPPPELLEYAKKHCNEEPETKLMALSELRDLVYERGECTPHRLDDTFLLRFLRARNFIPERAHRLLVNYYRFKEENPELYDNVYPLDLSFIGKANVLSVPPYRDQTGRRLMLYRIGCWDPSAYSVDEIFKATILSLELGVLEPRVQILGGVAVFDLEDIGMQHAWQVNTSVASRMIKLMVSSFPTTTHAIHIINHSWVFDKIYALFRPLLDARMRERIYFHGYDMTSLQRHINPECLPERYGGTQPEYSYTVWLETLRRNREVVREMLLCGYRVRHGELAEDLRDLVPDAPPPARAASASDAASEDGRDSR